MANAITHNLFIEQGEDYGIQITALDLFSAPIDITDAVIKAQISYHPQWDALATFSVDLIDPTNGVFVLALTADQTRDIPESSAYWDCFIKLGSLTYKAAQGSCDIVLAISK